MLVSDSGGVLAWLSVWSEVQTCTWASWCHCHSLSLASVKSRLVLPFWYWLTRVVPEKGPLNGCVCVCVCARACVCWSPIKWQYFCDMLIVYSSSGGGCIGISGVSWCSSCYVAKRVRAVKERWSSNPNQWFYLILSPSTTRLLMEVALQPLCQLSHVDLQLKVYILFVIRVESWRWRSLDECKVS